MAKNPHPVEAWEASVIENAVRWSAFQFRGPYDRQKIEAPSRASAIAAGEGLLKERPDRAVMIYAITAEGRQALAQTLRAPPAQQET